MVEKLGKIALSFLITNWIYSEALLICPQLRPITQRIIAVARIPTHNEWSGIAHSPSARGLGESINSHLEQSSLRGFFVKAGVLDRKVQGLMQARRGETIENGAGEENLPFYRGDAIFVTTAAKEGLQGGYREFN